MLAVYFLSILFVSGSLILLFHGVIAITSFCLTYVVQHNECTSAIGKPFGFALTGFSFRLVTYARSANEVRIQCLSLAGNRNYSLKAYIFELIFVY